MVDEEGGLELLREPVSRHVVGALAALFQDHAAFRGGEGVGEVEIDHAVRLHGHHQFQPVAGDVLEVDRVVVGGEGVVATAVAGDDLGKLAGCHLLRALEHHVLKIVGDPRLGGWAVVAADLVPQHMTDYRHPVIGDHHHLQPVGEGEALGKIEALGGGRHRCQRREGKRESSQQPEAERGGHGRASFGRWLPPARPSPARGGEDRRIASTGGGGRGFRPTV